MPEITADDLKYLSEFQKITGIHPSYCVATEGAFVFLVENKGELFKCIGKKRSTLNRLVYAFRKPVFVFVSSSDLEEQIRNMFHNLSKINIKINEIDGRKQVTLIVMEAERGFAVGKAGNKIKGIKEVLLKKFNVKDFHLKTTKEFRDEPEGNE